MQAAALRLFQLVALLALAACAPRAAPADPAAGGRAASPGAQASPAAAKVISIGMQLQEEPVGHGGSTGIVNITGPGTSGGSGQAEHRLIFHAGLTVYDDHSVL